MFLRYVLLLTVLAAMVAATPSTRDLTMPRYDHIFVIMEENKDYGQIIGSKDAPTIGSLAKTYGVATQFFAETHPSEPNYVALVGGSTYGIRDDDAFYCHADDTRKFCRNAKKPGYPNHTISGPSLASQLQSAGLTWKNYNESLPEAGSLAVVAADPKASDVPAGLLVYASKHSGFVNFASVQNDPDIRNRLVGFDRLWSDLRSGNVPNFSFIVPNLCNEMHGSQDDDSPEDCRVENMNKLIWRGDSNVKRIVDAIVASPVWKAPSNSAIVITFDEDDHGGKSGCCGTDPNDPSNSGGGHIATVVVTNHGPRGVVDATPYSHYSLLRTIEDAFGIQTHLQHAADPTVVPMLPLFAPTSP
jgi:phospholipase C